MSFRVLGAWRYSSAVLASSLQARGTTMKVLGREVPSACWKDTRGRQRGR